MTGPPIRKIAPSLPPAQSWCVAQAQRESTRLIAIHGKANAVLHGGSMAGLCLNPSSTGRSVSQARVRALGIVKQPELSRRRWTATKALQGLSTTCFELEGHREVCVHKTWGENKPFTCVTGIGTGFADQQARRSGCYPGQAIHSAPRGHLEQYRQKARQAARAKHLLISDRGSGAQFLLSSCQQPCSTRRSSGHSV